MKFFNTLPVQVLDFFIKLLYFKDVWKTPSSPFGRILNNKRTSYNILQGVKIQVKAMQKAASKIVASTNSHKHANQTRYHRNITSNA